MTRRFILFLALLLPLQFAWANAAAYCEHETNPAHTRHFGHHTHLHKVAGEKQPASKLAGDNDCGTCHAVGSPVIFDAPTLAAPLSAAASVVPHTLRRLPTALTRAPDRPQWLRLA